MGIWEDYCIGKLTDMIGSRRKTADWTDCGTDIGNIIPRIDNSRTPNDFGFQKRSFSIVFLENELKKLAGRSIEKEISEIDRRDVFSGLKNAESIDLSIIREQDNKDDKKSIAAEIKKSGDKADKGSDAEHKAAITSANSRNWEYFGEKVLAASNAYSRHSDMYRNFMDTYLYGSGQESLNPAERFEWNSGKKDRSIPSDEIISYKEKTEYIQAIMMNALMHAPMNHADPRVKDRYEAWKLSSKFYEQLSFVLCDNVLSPN
jgi:hypothetical protein